VWKPELAAIGTGAVADRRDSRTMATRRRLFRGRLTFAAVGGLVLALMLGGSVFVSNQVTAMRADIARLESRQDFLEAGSAQLLTRWNRETGREAIVARARRELDLVVPETPGLVLLEASPSDEGRGGALRRFFGRLGGAGEARAAELPVRNIEESMVSLYPRTDSGESAPTP
jgi:hypothetical protein